MNYSSPHNATLPVDLDTINATHLAQSLAGATDTPPLLIDCSALVSLRTLGVSHVVSQLLVLRRAGASIWLHNVQAPLRHCLQLLQLHRLFHIKAGC
jgi:anti-anti-sigma regulatory factor